jgi:hypothetical protein
MKKILILLFSISILWSNSDRAMYLKKYKNEKKVALVVGNSEYKNLAKLKNPINDANDVSNALKNLGFEVMTVTNATQSRLDRKLREFSVKLNTAGVGLFYFAGHGIEVEKKNYLVPLQANISDKLSVKYNALSVDEVVDRMKSSKTRLNLVVLDACRNDPFSRGGGGLAVMPNAKGTLIAYATAAGSVAKDNRSGRNGLYTKHFLKYIKKANLNQRDLFHKIRTDVYRESGQDQLPYLNDGTIGDFYFVVDENVAYTKPKPKSTFGFTDIAPTTFGLTINTTPYDARVQIMNITPKYYDGIKLKKGKYDIKISKSGYITKQGFIDLKSNTSINITLKEEEKYVAPVSRPTTVTTTNNGYQPKWNPKIYKGKRSYSRHSSNTVKDNYTGLIWQKSNNGQKYNWNDAKSYCSSLSLDGITNWRLPTQKELYYLADRNRYKPAIDDNYFSIKIDDWYWSATTDKSDTSGAWIVDFYSGDDFNSVKSLERYVLCVADSNL